MTLVRILCLLMLFVGSAAAEESVQDLYDRGTAAAEAGKDGEAVDLLYAGLEKLRAAKQGESPDAGLFAAGIARSLAALDSPQADDAYRLAVALLARSEDAVPFVSIAREFTNRLILRGDKDEAIRVAEAMLRRMRAGTMADPVKASTIETAIGAYGAAGREADADGILAEAASLSGDDASVAYLRGLARMQMAQAAQKAGRMVELASALDAAIADMARAGARGTELRGILLLMRGQMALTDGEYRKALPAIEAAIPILEADAKEEDSWVTALALRGRLLERLDRVSDAVAAADEEIAAFEKRQGAASPVASAARLDRIEFLVRAGRRVEARAALGAESDRLGNKADPTVAGFFYERLAAIEYADGHYREAVDAAEEAIAIRRQYAPDFRVLLIEPMRVRASAAEGIADLDCAERAHREMIALSESIYPPNHPEIARDLDSFAGLLASFRRFDEAEAIGRRSAAILKVAYGEAGAKYAFALHNLGTFIMFNGKASEAVDLFSAAIAIADRLPEQEDFRALARFNLASALIQVKRYGDALAAARDAETRTSALPPPVGNRLSAIYGVEMQALDGLGRYEEATAAGRQMIAAGSKATYQDAANLTYGMTSLAGLLVKAGPPADALLVARQAMAMTQSLALGGGGIYRGVSTALVDAAWQMTGKP
ncbi:MAG: hypothetical protein ABI399_01135 [Bauldia sp.]